MNSPPDIPKPPRPRREPLTKMETVYLNLLKHWYAYRTEPPSCEQLAQLTRPAKSHTSIRSALLSAETKGYCRRNKHGKFEVIP